MRPVGKLGRALRRSPHVEFHAGLTSARSRSRSLRGREEDEEEEEKGKSSALTRLLVEPRAALALAHLRDERAFARVAHRRDPRLVLALGRRSRGLGGLGRAPDVAARQLESAATR